MRADRNHPRLDPRRQPGTRPGLRQRRAAGLVARSQERHRLRAGDRRRQHRRLCGQRCQRHRAGPGQRPGQLRQQQLRRGGHDPGPAGRGIP